MYLGYNKVVMKGHIMKNILETINLFVLVTISFWLFILPKRILTSICTILVALWVCCIAIPLYALFGCDVREALSDLFKSLEESTKD